MNEKRLEIAKGLEKLVHRRFTERELNMALSEIFGENVRVEKVMEDCDYFPDYAYGWNSEKEGIAGFFDIYYLKHKPNYTGDETIYVTEVGYEWESCI